MPYPHPQCFKTIGKIIKGSTQYYQYFVEWYANHLRSQVKSFTWTHHNDQQATFWLLRTLMCSPKPPLLLFSLHPLIQSHMWSVRKRSLRCCQPRKTYSKHSLLHKIIAIIISVPQKTVHFFSFPCLKLRSEKGGKV